MLEPVRDIGAVVTKDLVIELRSREILYSMGLFAVMVVVIFAVALVSEPQAARTVGPAILWVAFAFAGTLGLNRIASREQEGDCLTGLVVSPASRGGIFLGKVVACFLFMAAMEALLLPMVAVLFDLDLLPQLGWHLLLVALGTLGFSAVGTLFATMLLSTRLREVLLPLIVYPIVTPVLMAGVKGNGALLASDPTEAFTWIKLLLVFDLLFTTAAAWAFGWTLGE